MAYYDEAKAKERAFEESVRPTAAKEPDRNLSDVLEEARQDGDYWRVRTVVNMEQWLREAQLAEEYLDQLREEIGQARVRMRETVNQFVDERVGRVDSVHAEAPGRWG